MIRLVPFGAQHAEKAAAWESDARVYADVPGFEPAGLAERLARRLAPPPELHCLALMNGVPLLVGCAELHVGPTEIAFVMYIGPEHQRHGYGGAAVRDLLALGESVAPGLPCVIRVFADQPGLREWYERHGFHKIGREYRRHLDELRPLLVMSTHHG